MGDKPRRAGSTASKIRTGANNGRVFLPLFLPVHTQAGSQLAGAPRPPQPALCLQAPAFSPGSLAALRPSIQSPQRAPAALSYCAMLVVPKAGTNAICWCKNPAPLKLPLRALQAQQTTAMGPPRGPRPPRAAPTPHGRAQPDHIHSGSTAASKYLLFGAGAVVAAGHKLYVVHRGCREVLDVVSLIPAQVSCPGVKPSLGSHQLSTFPTCRNHPAGPVPPDHQERAQKLVFPSSLAVGTCGHAQPAGGVRPAPAWWEGGR